MTCIKCGRADAMTVQWHQSCYEKNCPFPWNWAIGGKSGSVEHLFWACACGWTTRTLTADCSATEARKGVLKAMELGLGGTWSEKQRAILDAAIPEGEPR